MDQLCIGDKAPAFSLLNQEGKKVSLSQYKGKKILLYFYPKADTPGCTKQACSIKDASKELEKFGIVAIGISPDEPSKQNKLYGVWGKKSMYGKTYEGIIRSSFVIDGQGKIVQASYKVKPLDTVTNALKALK